MIKLKQLEPDDLALAYILQDNILFGQFLRSTADGDMENKSAWEDFKYRHYQKDLMTDKNPYIVLTGGRSIGKCLLGTDRIYTDRGYKRHQELENKSFKAWSINKEGQLELRRGFSTFNGLKACIYIQTALDNNITGTFYHPVFTQNGYKILRDVKVGELVAVSTKLPHVINNDNVWQDVRLIGYMLYKVHGYTLNKTPLVLKSKRAREELKVICEHLNLTHLVTDDGVILKSKRQFDKHPLTTLFNYFGMNYVRQYSAWNTKNNRLSAEIMQLNEKDLTIFLEAFCSQYAILDIDKIRIPIPNYRMENQFKELFLRFGVMMKSVEDENTRREITKDKSFIQRFDYYIETIDEQDAYRFWNTFKIPGYLVNAPKVESRPQWIFTPIVKKEKRQKRRTYAVQIEGNHTYIGNDIHVHNSYILEDKMLFDLFNSEKQLGRKAQIVLSTANLTQMTPLLDSLNTRILRSPLLSHFTKSGVNKQAGTLDLDIGGRQVRLYARIAGNKGSSNVVGLHLPKAVIDEGQLYPQLSFTELMPAINPWDEQKQVTVAGVPNGLTNTVLYRLDMKSPKYKKYRIPAPCNPWYSYKDFRDALREYGGEDDDRFQTLVLGKHGKGSEQVLIRDQIGTETYPFYQYQYTYNDKNNGLTYQDRLIKHDFKCDMYMCGIDTGFVDPTIISIFGLKNSKWYHLCRYKLQRIQFPEQEMIIHYLHQHYNFSRIGIDLGAGGNAPAIIQSLMTRSEYKGYQYDKIIEGIQSNQNILVGYDQNNIEIHDSTRNVAATELVSFIQNQTIIYNDMDNEALSQLERIAKQKGLNGRDRYFILNEKGAGMDKNDHIFASFLCFVMLIRDLSFLNKKRKKLGKTTR